MRRLAIAAIGAVALLGLGWMAHAQQAGNAQPVAPPAPTNKAAYFDHTEMLNIWKDLEARQVINKRVMEGGTYSINIRIFKEDAAPLVHALTSDLWVVQAGTATAVTGGELLDIKKNAASDDASGSSIRGGVEQPVKPGDMVFVPPGVPHTFKSMKGFRAYLIRFPTK